VHVRASAHRGGAGPRVHASNDRRLEQEFAVALAGWQSPPMPTYVYESVADTPGAKTRRFEVKQSMNERPLTHDPETGLPVRRLISGGFLMLKGEESTPGGEAGACDVPTPSHSCGSGCGCFAGN
jgi:predicted nucleic acid-binding Zn ribbon protein